MSKFLCIFYERFGLNAFVLGDYAKAEKWFRKLEAEEPDSIRVLRNLGVILLAKGEGEAAERYLLREEKLYGPTFNRHCALADLAYARGKRKEAERRYALALAEPEAGPGGRSERMRPILERRLRVCASEADFQATREAMKRFMEAEAAREGAEFERAVSLFKEAARLDETNWPALNNAGSLLLNKLGRPAEALELFERALGPSGSPQVAHNLELAEAALKAGSAASAKAAAKAAKRGLGRGLGA